jgi:hypothetical protein
MSTKHSARDLTLILSAQTRGTRPPLLAGVMTNVFAPVSRMPSSSPARTQSPEQPSLQSAPLLNIGHSSPRRSINAPGALRDGQESALKQPRTATPGSPEAQSSSASHLPIISITEPPSLDITSSIIRPSLLDARVTSPRGTTPSPSLGFVWPFANTSSSSIGTTSNPGHRELIRAAVSLLCRELGRGSAQLRRNGFSNQDCEEVEVRIRYLVRLERIWSKIGPGSASSSNVSASGEERERRVFTEALRDGYVLCQ